LHGIGALRRWAESGAGDDLVHDILQLQDSGRWPWKL